MLGEENCHFAVTLWPYQAQAGTLQLDGGGCYNVSFPRRSFRYESTNG
jgi:hypothetical protein